MMQRSPEILHNEGKRLAEGFSQEETISVSSAVSGVNDAYGRRWIVQDFNFSSISPPSSARGMQVTGPIDNGKPIQCWDIHPYLRSAYIEGIYNYHYEWARPQGQQAYISATVITYEEYTTLYKHVPKSNNGSRTRDTIRYGVDDFRYDQYWNGAGTRSGQGIAAGAYVNAFSDKTYCTSGDYLSDELRQELFDFRLSGGESWLTDSGYGFAFPVPKKSVDIKGYRNSTPYCYYTYNPSLYDIPVTHNALSGFHFLTSNCPWWHTIVATTVSLGDRRSSWIGYRFYLGRNTYIDDKLFAQHAQGR